MSKKTEIFLATTEKTYPYFTNSNYYNIITNHHHHHHHRLKNPMWAKALPLLEFRDKPFSDRQLHTTTPRSPEGAMFFCLGFLPRRHVPILKRRETWDHRMHTVFPVFCRHASENKMDIHRTTNYPFDHKNDQYNFKISHAHSVVLPAIHRQPRVILHAVSAEPFRQTTSRTIPTNNP
jgi:hypothetical protein